MLLIIFSNLLESYVIGASILVFLNKEMNIRILLDKIFPVLPILYASSNAAPMS